MLIIFNKSGSEFQVDFQFDSFSQGDTNIHIIDVIVEDTAFNNYDYNAYVQFLREGESTPSPKMMMTYKKIEHNGVEYQGYSYKMATDWYTSIAGNLKTTIEIKQYSNGKLLNNKAYGIVNIPIQAAVSEIAEVNTTITNEEYVALVENINSKLNVADYDINKTWYDEEEDFADHCISHSKTYPNDRKVFFASIGDTETIRYECVGLVKRDTEEGTYYCVVVSPTSIQTYEMNATDEYPKKVPTTFESLNLLELNVVGEITAGEPKSSRGVVTRNYLMNNYYDRQDTDTNFVDVHSNQNVYGQKTFTEPLKVNALLTDNKEFYIRNSTDTLELSSGDIRVNGKLLISDYDAKEYTDNAVKKAMTDIVDGASDVYDTFKEVAQYIESDISGAQQMTANIQKNADNIAQLDSKKANRNELFNKDYNELVNKPDEALVILRDYVSDDTNKPAKEIELNGEKWALTAELDQISKVTWDVLITMRDKGELIAGRQYRITDYVTTTSQDETRSAGHQFDIIVVADDNKTLNEKARAIQHEGDTYFANSRLNAWELWYCLDNDTNRFGWADEENGKGVIYRMIDEWDNDLPYDFKNIQFKRYLVESEDFVYDKFNGLYVGCKDLYGELILPQGYVASSDETDFEWRYTFSWINEEYEVDDYSIVGNLALLNDEMFISGCYKNKMGITTEYDVVPDTEEHPNRMWLGNNVFFDSYQNEVGTSYGFYSNTIGNGFFCNTIGNNFHSNKIGNSFFCNTIGNYFTSNAIGNSFTSNTIGDSFNSNTIGDVFAHNTTENNFLCNTIGNSFISNTIGDAFHTNTIGNNFTSNTIGDDFYCNTIGNYFNYNTIVNNFNYNTIGNGFESNTIGANFHYNTIGNGFTHCGITSFVKYMNVEDGVMYFEMLANAGNDNNYIQNITIKSGVIGSSDNNKLSFYVERNLSYHTTYKPVGSEELTVSMLGGGE